MKRIVAIALLVIVLAASTASADMYGSLRYAGMFNLKEFAFGSQSEKLGFEVAVGYTKASLGDLDILGDILDDIEVMSDDMPEPDLTIMSLGAAVFFTMADNSQYSFDLGARAQYLSIALATELPDEVLRSDDEMEISLTGLSFGPVLRGRWYLADGAIAIGPEIYPKYTMYSTEASQGSDSSDGPSLNVIDLEYSLRMEFYF